MNQRHNVQQLLHSLFGSLAQLCDVEHSEVVVEGGQRVHRQAGLQSPVTCRERSEVHSLDATVHQTHGGHEVWLLLQVQMQAAAQIRILAEQRQTLWQQLSPDYCRNGLDAEKRRSVEWVLENGPSMSPE